MRIHQLPAVISFLCLLPLLSFQAGCVSPHSILQSTATFPPDTGFVGKTVALDGQEHRYVIFVPHNYNPQAKYPAILFLHGLFEGGSDGLHQLTAGLAPIIAQNPTAWPFIVVFPQSTGTWIGSSRDRLAIACLDDTQATYSIDPNRIILSGMSFGGRGVWDVAANHPNRFAALVPFSAVTSDFDPLKFITIPIWAFHNSADPIVSARASREFCKRISNAGGNITFTEFPALAHDSCPQAYSQTDLINWMLQQHRTPTASTQE